MKRTATSNLGRTILAVPAAALMLGAAEAGTTVGINFSGDTYGYFAGVPVTATAFGVGASDWQSTPISWGGVGYDYASTSGSMTVADLGVSWNATNTWLTVGWDPPTPVPGDAEVTYGMLDNTGWSCGLTNLNAKFPSGYVVELIGAGKTTATSSVSITENSGSTLVGTVTFTLLSNGHGLGASPVLANDAVTLTNISRNDPTNCALGGFIVTDKPVVSRKPIGTTVATGDTISLTARAVGIPPMTYQWFNGATPVTAIATEPTADTITTTYTKSGAVAGDSGSYTLVVTNAHGTGTSVAAAVTVTVPATMTWDADGGTTGSQDGSGTWNATNTNWWDGAGDVAWSNLNFANFGSGGSGAATVTLDDDALASGLTFSNVDYTLTTTAAKTLSLAGSPQITTNSNATLAVPLAGTGTLTKTGAGTLTLDTKGSFSGPINVQQGTLNLPSSPPGYWYQWLLNSSVINLSPGTSLTMNGGAFGWYGNNNAGGLTVNVDGAICQPSGAFGIGYNLKGGTLGTGTSRLDMGRSGGFNSFINSKASSTTSVVNPAGGEVLFRNDSGQTVFTFDTEAGTTLNGIDLDIQKPLNQTSGSSIVKTGPGTMKLSAVNNYSGGTTINGGKLALTGRVSGGPFTMNDNTALSVAAAGGTSAVSTTGTMTVGSDPVTPAGTNTLEFAGLSSISVAPISVGYVYLDNPVTINIASVTPLVGQYPLIKFSNAGGASVVGLTLGTLPAGITATLVDDTAGASQSIYLDVTDVVVPTSIWAGTVNGTWDIATTGNWSGASALYSDGNIAEFDDSASPVNTNITLNTTVNPAEVAFYNDTLNYTISGSGTIAGFTQLFKTAGGTLTLNNNNTYTGKTTVTGGILELGGSLATSEIANSAALVYNLSSPQTVSYALTGGGSLTKTGAATLTLQGNKNFGGGVIVNQGTLHINAGGWYTNPFGQTNTVTVNSGGTLSTAYAHSLGVDQNTIVINGGTLALGAENYISNLQMTGGTVSGGELRTWGGTMTFNASSTGAVISSPFSLVGGATLSVDDGSVADDLTISGVIFNGNGITKTGAGTLRLTGVNTYTGATNLNQGTLAINGTSIADATNLVINGGIVAVTGTETVNALFFGSAQQASGTWGATGSGAAHIDDTRFSGTGVVSVTTAPDFSAWAVANAPGQTVSQDHDNDGITNGIEYFMGLSGSAFTANPGVVAGKVSWPKGAAYIGAYGVDYVVQTSPDLSTWTDILVGDPNLSNGSPLEYTLPAATKVFTRLKVTGP